jgi:hypothetical protein
MWMAAALLTIALAELPWIWRMLFAGLLGLAGLPLRSFVLLRGPRALRALEWNEEFFVWRGHPGQGGRQLPAVPTLFRRYGASLWVLGFETVEGRCGLLLDTARQDPRSLRRLARRLDRGFGPGPGEPASGKPGEKLLASRPKV